MTRWGWRTSEAWALVDSEEVSGTVRIRKKRKLIPSPEGDLPDWRCAMVLDKMFLKISMSTCTAEQTLAKCWDGKGDRQWLKAQCQVFGPNAFALRCLQVQRHNPQVLRDDLGPGTPPPHTEMSHSTAGGELIMVLLRDAALELEVFKWPEQRVEWVYMVFFFS